MRNLLNLLLLIGITSTLAGCASTDIKPRYSAAFYQDGVFASAQDDNPIGFTETLSLLWKHITSAESGQLPSAGEIPVIPLSYDDVLNMPEDSMVRLSHSNLLFKLDGKLVMTDPMFSERASPFSFLGPKRFHPTPIAVDELPPIDVVIISHNHYDHLDEPTLTALRDKIGAIYVPIGIKQHLLDLGYRPQQITELDWWETANNGSLSISATPSQHFSGRGFFDKNHSLWSSWVIQSTQSSLFFSGDSGYFDGFKEIGERFGPFDVTFMEDGAYNERWRSMHMMPEEAVQAHIELQGKWLFPIHNSTFKLAFHPWKEPLQRIYKAAQERQVKLVIPKMGEIINIQQPKVAESEWWQNKPLAAKEPLIESN